MGPIDSVNSPTGNTPSYTGREVHPEDIKAQIRKRGLSLSELSRRHGHHPEAARQALRTPWRKWERIIAEFLEVHPRELWPQRYDEDGKRKRGLSSGKKA